MYLFSKLTECEINFEQECQKYEDQLKKLESEKQQLEAQLRSTQKSPEDAVCNSQVNMYVVIVD